VTLIFRLLPLLIVASTRIDGQPSGPIVHDPRLRLTLYAQEPDIVTPVGLAIDSKDRLFVIESHTHLAPADYPGPRTDRIKVFEDTNHDGTPDRLSIFSDNVREAMNLAVSPNGELYVVCAREVLALRDRDGDGVCDWRKQLVRVETSNHYPHSCLLGVTLSHDGWLYVSRGNNGSAAYTIYGTDGRSLAGWGDGGNVFRCRPDGSELEEVATGFWNPFDLKFDHSHRLLLVDNDPDARGPNRFLHVVPGGDYGYKSLYGGGGNHPFQAWEGDLPGTLPMIDGTGEAPSGLLDCARAALPVDYANHYLVTIWNENSIARHVTQLRGSSLTGTHSPWITGDQQFRPVALDADSRGVIFFTDWVLVDYPNHGRGRIWRVSAQGGQPLSQPTSIHTRTRVDPGLEALRKMAGTAEPGQFPGLRDTLQSDDPFLRHSAVMALTHPVYHSSVMESAAHTNPSVRLGALLALRRAHVPDPGPLLRRFLADPDDQVCRLAVIWVGESNLTFLRAELDKVLNRPRLSPALFETWIAAQELLQPEFVTAWRGRSQDHANRLPRRLPPGLIDRIVRDDALSLEVRALALTRLDAPSTAGHETVVIDLARHAPPFLQKEAIRTLARSPTPRSENTLRTLALDRSQGPAIRAEALLAISWFPAFPYQSLLPILDDPHPDAQLEAARLLRFHAGDPDVREAVRISWERAIQVRSRADWIEQLEFTLFPPGVESGERTRPRPVSLEQWEQAVARGGNPDAGERVFFSPSISCSQCHTVHNRGGRIGPDLSHIARSVTRTQIIRSVLRPSQQFPPQYQAWFVETQDGETHQGLQLDHKSAGAIELFVTSGKTVHFKADEIARYGVLQTSLMPDGLEAGMTVEDLRNVVAFLESLR
jgi:hypothetical protein